MTTLLTTKKIQAFEKELQAMKIRLTETETNTDILESAQEDSGELSMYDNHPADLGTELYEREKDIALHSHAEGELGKVENALQAIKDGTYGICEVCGKEIQVERLEAIPYATVCIEDAKKDTPTDRPVENDQLLMAEPNSFAARREGDAIDYEDSFQEIAQSGTSETPSDFMGNKNRDYDDLYNEENEEGVEEYEEFAVTDITGKPTGFVRNEQSEEYEEALDEEGIESPLGDIPYKKGDSYIDDKKDK